MGRVCPNLPATLVFTEEECRVLYHAANKIMEEHHHKYTIKEPLEQLAIWGGRKGEPIKGQAVALSIWKVPFRLGILLGFCRFSPLIVVGQVKL